MTARVSRINLPQIRYSNGSFLHINSCIYGDYFGNLLAFPLDVCACSLLHPWLLSIITLISTDIDFLLCFSLFYFATLLDSVQKSK